MSGVFKVPKGVTTVTVGPILGGSGGSDARGFVVGGGGGTLGSISGVGGSGIVNNGSGITRTPPAWVDPSVLEHFIKDHVIEGQTVMVEHTYPGNVGDGRYNVTEDNIKQLLMDKLVVEMYKANHIEFTRMERYETNEMVFRARIHVVPDAQVRIIREIKDARKTT
jgi:hypothetical protein